MTSPATSRLLVLVSWRERGGWYFRNKLIEAGHTVTVRGPWLPSGPRWLTRLSVWLARFYVPLWAVGHARAYDAVVSWNLPYATVLGLCKRLLAPLRRLPPHLARDFHFDPNATGSRRYACKLRLLAAAMPGIDWALTTSRAECTVYAARFTRPSTIFQFFPDAPPSELFAVPPMPVGEHILAYGNSDRDFETVLAAAARLSAPVTLLSQNFVAKLPPSPNVTWLRHYVSRQELIRLIATARCCVVPLRDYRVAAGQNSMFEIMALGRPLVISENIAVAEYVTPGSDALTFAPQDAAGLATCLQSILDDPAKAEAMGRQARQTSRRWLDQQVFCFSTLLEALAARKDT